MNRLLVLIVVAIGLRAQADEPPVTFRLEVSPVAVEYLEMIIPMGKVGGSHVTPIDHQYWITRGWKPRGGDDGTRFPVRAPAGGEIVTVQHMTRPVSEPGRGPKMVDDYRVVIQHTEHVQTILIHIKTLVDRILAANERRGIRVKAGEVIGYVGRQSFDVSIHDARVTLRGLLSPALYRAEPWKVHTVDLFDLYPEPLRGKLLARCLRQAEPRGGRIDHDVDGRLVGNWFLDGTNGYRGVDRNRYWAGHLSVVYDHLDPSQVRISLGDFDGRSRQFAVLGNRPDPAEVRISTGAVSYALVRHDYLVARTRERWDRLSFAPGGVVATAGERVEGTLRLQLLGPRRLKLECFPGKTPAQVSGFTDRARIYVR